VTGTRDTIWTSPLLCLLNGCAVRQDSLGTLDCMQGGTECLVWSGVQARPGQKVVGDRANGVLYVLDQDSDTGSSR
jgi:hypothetical protein